jgi:hypothetical protein
MLFREDGDDAIAIAQPSHAWLSGQLARAWGNERFAAPAPYEEVCLGAEQHDIGWHEWEAAPSFNPRTGRPHAFTEVGAETHLALWARGAGRALAFGRYAALLVSLHAKTIYGTYYDVAKAPAHEAARVRRFLAEQEAFREGLVASLAAEPRHMDSVSPQALERNRRLVAATDRLSLEICWGVAGERRIPDVPESGDERVELRLSAPRGDAGDLVLDPWPFAASQVELLCEGRRLRGRSPDEAAMRRALGAAERITVAATLRPR